MWPFISRTKIFFAEYRIDDGNVLLQQCMMEYVVCCWLNSESSSVWCAKLVNDDSLSKYYAITLLTWIYYIIKKSGQKNFYSFITFSRSVFVYGWLLIKEGKIVHDKHCRIVYSMYQLKKGMNKIILPLADCIVLNEMCLLYACTSLCWSLFVMSLSVKGSGNLCQ